MGGDGLEVTLVHRLVSLSRQCRPKPDCFLIMIYTALEDFITRHLLLTARLDHYFGRSCTSHEYLSLSLSLSLCPLKAVLIKDYSSITKTSYSIAMGACNTILSAYTKYRHLGSCCTHQSIC